MPTLEITIDNAKNASLLFKPLNRPIRGRLDFGRMREAGAVEWTTEDKFPDGVPGQRLRLDLDKGTAEIVDGLHDPEAAPVRRKLQANYALPEAAEAIPGPLDLVTWVYWMRRAVESGHARLTAGSWPKLDGVPRKNFHQTPKVADPKDEQNAILWALLKSKLSAKDLAEIEARVGK